MYTISIIYVIYVSNTWKEIKRNVDWLLQEAESLVGQKLHPQTIVSGWRKAVDEARRALTESALDNG